MGFGWFWKRMAERSRQTNRGVLRQVVNIKGLGCRGPHWVVRMLRSSVSVQQPIRHLLLVNYIGICLEDLFASKPLPPLRKRCRSLLPLSARALITFARSLGRRRVSSLARSGRRCWVEWLKFSVAGPAAKCRCGASPAKRGRGSEITATCGGRTLQTVGQPGDPHAHGGSFVKVVVTGSKAMAPGQSR